MIHRFIRLKKDLPEDTTPSIQEALRLSQAIHQGAEGAIAEVCSLLLFRTAKQLKMKVEHHLCSNNLGHLQQVVVTAIPMCCQDGQEEIGLLRKVQIPDGKGQGNGDVLG